jgi:ketosteroid isomerase-like protein
VGELTVFVQRLLLALDDGDGDTATSMISPDAQAIDEVSGRWVRGDGELLSYVRELTAVAQDMRSEIQDVHEERWGDTGIVTFWLEQDYTLDGERRHVSAPTTYVLRRHDGAWRLVLGHSVPISQI